MNQAAPATAAHAPLRADLARVLFLVVAMTVWAEVNDRLAAHFHIGLYALIAMRTVVDCGGVVALGCVVWGKRSLRELGWRFGAPLRLLGVGVLALLVVLGAIAAAVVAKGGGSALTELAHEVAEQTPGQHIYFGLLGVKIAFWEETLFRGDLLAALTTRVGTATAVVLSAVVFGLYHLGWNDVRAGIGGILSLGILLKIVIGLVFAVATVRTRSLVPSAVAHALLWAVMGNA
jgi:membrane protease YdiL (CAAX protease family)